MKLVDNFYAYLWPGVTMAEMQKYGNNCNSYLVAGVLPENKHVLVDPGAIVNEVRRNCLDRLISEMSNDGIKIEDVGLILNTHLHPDHYGASETVRKMSGAQIAIGKGEDEFIKLMEGEMSQVLKQVGIDMPKINPDFYLTEGGLRLSQDLVVEVMHTPGHSQGHISIFWPDKRIFMGGDLIFLGSTGRVDIPGGNAQQLKESIEKVAQLEIDYLLTGHQYGSPGIIEGVEKIRQNYDVIRRSIFPYL